MKVQFNSASGSSPAVTIPCSTFSAMASLSPFTFTFSYCSTSGTFQITLTVRIDL